MGRTGSKLVVLTISIWFAALGVMTPPVSAHPGSVDVCKGHTTDGWVEYATMGNDGQWVAPSEPGEYHFHFSASAVRAGLQREVDRFMELARNTEGVVRVSFDDIDALLIDGYVYDIWEYTRQGDAILKCRWDDEVTHMGIVRVSPTEQAVK